MCKFVLRCICLSTFSHDAVQIFASPESIAGGTLDCKMGELMGISYCTHILSDYTTYNLTVYVSKFYLGSLLQSLLF